MRVAGLVPAVAVLVLCAPTPAEADGLRCGSRLVLEGTTRAQVLRFCGEPADVERRTAFRRPVYWRYGRPFYVGSGEVEVAIEFWTYNFGRSKLMRRIRMEDGVVASIETLGYGFFEPKSPVQER